MRVRKHLLQFVLLLSLVFTALQGAPVSVVRADNVREITVHYTGSKQDIAFHLWDETGGFFHSTQKEANWDDGSYPAVSGDHPYYVLKTNETDKTWTLGAIVRYGEDKEKVYEGDILIEITPEVIDIYLGDDSRVSFDGTSTAPTPESDSTVGRDSTFKSDAKDYIYIHLLNEGINPSQLTLWAWEDAHDDYREGNWDTDRLRPYDVTDQFATFKIGLIDDAQLLGFLFHYGDSQSSDYFFDVSTDVRDIYLRKDDTNVYQDAEFSDVQVQSVKWVDVNTLEIGFPSATTIDESSLKDSIELFKNGQTIDFSIAKVEDKSVQLTVGAQDFSVKDNYSITIDGRSMNVVFDWRFMDEHYATDAPLGTDWNNEAVTLNFWSPSATQVEVVLYDKTDQTKVLKTFSMDEVDHVWVLELKPSDVGVDSLTNTYYQFKITRFGETVYGLDPYARSMAPWDGIHKSASCDSTQPECIGKAAFVNPANTTMETSYADIEGYEGREDAIIYEVHVRDFTSDIEIDETLKAKFGTFSAFIEKLDYIESMGVTHIQLLPVMAYYNIDENNRDERVWDALAQGADSNYNWGYDPHSYFTLSGVYSEDNTNAELRIQEFKALIDEIHNREMGVILDVVYNHTAAVHIFEDLQPNYYHFMDFMGNSKTSFGGGRLGTTHHMASRILTDSIMYWVEEFKVDGFRFDMMGDHDAASIQRAYDLASKVNPNILMIGEGWVTFVGDDDERVQAADQKWMQYTSAVGSFSDEFRNELKSGFGSEGEPRFLTNGARYIETIFNNIKAQPGNFKADEPHDVVNYIEAHDNLTLYDVIAQSIKKDPKDNNSEILQRQRLGNFMVFTSQGTAFMQAGQEYGKTRQVNIDAFKEPVGACGTTMDEPIHKATCMLNADGTPFEYPYFIHDSYNSSDKINHFDWAKTQDRDTYQENVHTVDYTKGLIALRRSVDAFTLDTLEAIDEKVVLLEVEEQNSADLMLAYAIYDDDATYYVLINGDDETRTFTFDSKTASAIRKAEVLVDNQQAGSTALEEVSGLNLDETISVDALSGIVLRVETQSSMNQYYIMGGILVVLGVAVAIYAKKHPKVKHDS
ncbi:pullulanase [Erysipelothrix larvae]|uniref:pullulanase n=1 Tax=Erysipelothrix larvae TaxID=1514105 RepID=UPI00098F485C|nr:pullulanase [Erysipelothrix larvae]